MHSSGPILNPTWGQLFSEIPLLRSTGAYRHLLLIFTIRRSGGAHRLDRAEILGISHRRLDTNLRSERARGDDGMLQPVRRVSGGMSHFGQHRRQDCATKDRSSSTWAAPCREPETRGHQVRRSAFSPPMKDPVSCLQPQQLVWRLQVLEGLRSLGAKPARVTPTQKHRTARHRGSLTFDRSSPHSRRNGLDSLAIFPWAKLDSWRPHRHVGGQ
jgi:hypothetical protein